MTEAAVQAAFGVLAVEFSSWASLFALGGGTGAAGECRAWTTSDYWTRLTLRLSCLILERTNATGFADLFLGVEEVTGSASDALVIADDLPDRATEISRDGQRRRIGYSRGQRVTNIEIVLLENDSLK